MPLQYVRPEWSKQALFSEKPKDLTPNQRQFREAVTMGWESLLSRVENPSESTKIFLNVLRDRIAAETPELVSANGTINSTEQRFLNRVFGEKPSDN
jgi:hypothetical protein